MHFVQKESVGMYSVLSSSGLLRFGNIRSFRSPNKERPVKLFDTSGWRVLENVLYSRHCAIHPNQLSFLNHSFHLKHTALPLLSFSRLLPSLLCLMIPLAIFSSSCTTPTTDSPKQSYVFRSKQNCWCIHRIRGPYLKRRQPGRSCSWWTSLIGCSSTQLSLLLAILGSILRKILTFPYPNITLVMVYEWVKPFCGVIRNQFSVPFQTLGSYGVRSSVTTWPCVAEEDG